MTDVIRYQSIRNGKIGTLVSESETEVILDFEGAQKTIKIGNLKRWYRVCTITDDNELKQAKESASICDRLNKLVDKPDKPKNDKPPKQDCSKLAVKIITYLENNGLVTKKTQSYTRVRLPESPLNIMELWWGKTVKNLKIVVRSEALYKHKELFDLGTLYAINNYYALDLFYRVDNSWDISTIYKIIDAAIIYERNEEHPQRVTKGRKVGQGLVNGRPTLNYKRRLLGVKTDMEKAVE